MIHTRCQAKNKHGVRCGTRPTTYRGMYELCWIHSRVYEEYGKLEVYESRFVNDTKTIILEKSSKPQT